MDMENQTTRFNLEILPSAGRGAEVADVNFGTVGCGLWSANPPNAAAGAPEEGLERR